jgi:RHS repeat-associated protein
LAFPACEYGQIEATSARRAIVTNASFHAVLRLFERRRAAASNLMHARYYSASIGRFLSIDPVGGRADDSQSWNRYSYVQNNPILRTDPDGRCPWCVPAAIGGAVGIVAGGVGELWSQGFGSDAPVEWDKVAAAAAGGGVSGVLAGATMGVSTIGEGGLASAVVVNASANIVGGATTRALQGDGSVNAKQIAIDGATGGVAGALGHGAATVASRQAPALATQVEASRAAARAGGGYGAAQSARGAAAKLARVTSRAAAVNTVIGAQGSNVIAPNAQHTLEEKRKQMHESKKIQ